MALTQHSIERAIGKIDFARRIIDLDRTQDTDQLDVNDCTKFEFDYKVASFQSKSARFDQKFVVVIEGDFIKFVTLDPELYDYVETLLKTGRRHIPDTNEMVNQLDKNLFGSKWD